MIPTLSAATAHASIGQVIAGFGTIAAESQRLINEIYSAFVQGFMPTSIITTVAVTGLVIDAIGNRVATHIRLAECQRCVQRRRASFHRYQAFMRNRPGVRAILHVTRPVRGCSAHD
jgi:hypothetical protein